MRLPLTAGATRGRHVRATLRSRGFAYAAVLGAAAALVAGAAGFGAAGALLGPCAWLLALSSGVVALAAQRARFDFWSGLARSLGLSYVGRVDDLLPLTPLLGAGDRRWADHWLIGALPGSGGAVRCAAGLFSYAVRGAGDDELRERGAFTVAVADLPEALTLFHGIHLRRRDALRRVRGAEWVSARRTRAVSLESAAFADRYELRVAHDRDDLQLRELFSPSLIAWLAAHPLAPQIEISAGTLVVFLDGHRADAGTLVALLDCARELAARMALEVEEERAAGRVLSV